MLTEIKRTVTELVPIGMYLVTFDKIWGTQCLDGEHDDCFIHGCMDQEPDYVAYIEPLIVKITKNNYLNLSESVINCDDSWNNETLWEGDTHDLRPRIFKTKSEAKEHVKKTIDRFNNSLPWEVFIKS